MTSPAGAGLATYPIGSSDGRCVHRAVTHSTNAGYGRLRGIPHSRRPSSQRSLAAVQFADDTPVHARDQPRPSGCDGLPKSRRQGICFAARRRCRAVCTIVVRVRPPTSRGIPDLLSTLTSRCVVRMLRSALVLVKRLPLTPMNRPPLWQFRFTAAVSFVNGIDQPNHFTN